MKWPNSSSASYFSVKLGCCLGGCSLRSARHCCTESSTGYFTKFMDVLVPESFLLPLKLDVNCMHWRLPAGSKDISNLVLNGLGGYWHSGGSSSVEWHEVVCVGWLLNSLFTFPGGFCSLTQVCRHHLQSQQNQRCKYIPNLTYSLAATNIRETTE